MIKSFLLLHELAYVTFNRSQIIRIPRVVSHLDKTVDSHIEFHQIFISHSRDAFTSFHFISFFQRNFSTAQQTVHHSRPPSSLSCMHAFPHHTHIHTDPLPVIAEITDRNDRTSSWFAVLVGDNAPDRPTHLMSRLPSADLSRFRSEPSVFANPRPNGRLTVLNGSLVIDWSCFSSGRIPEMQ